MITIDPATGLITGAAVVDASVRPMFSAYQNSNQSLSSGTPTKLSFQTEEFDTTSAFSSGTMSTNGDSTNRFTPQVAGYYQVNAALYANTTTTASVCAIYKNGTLYKAGVSNAGSTALPISSLVQLNGSTDYVEIWGTLTGTTPSLFAASHLTWCNAALISRSA